jgi:hypothetical protein
MMRRIPTAGLLTLLVLAGLTIPGTASAQLEGHPNDLPRLLPDGHFPRCTYAELEGIGFPDHKHAWHWRGWEPLTDDNGQAYGPGAFCRQDVIQDVPGLVSIDSVQSYGHFVIHHDPGYEACDMLYFLELLDMAGREIPPLLGLPLVGTLEVHNPDNIEVYRQATGYDVWRLYKRDGDLAIVEPLPVLQARTLDAHALYALVTEWLLATNIPADLPPWLSAGLASYIAEDGIHLVNYMGQFRPMGPILFSPPLIDSILGGSPNPNPETDREMYRRATYSAFLMVWELVENQGGLEALRDLLDRLSGGADLDEAFRLVYGMGRQDLEMMLDPAALGEPIGKATQSRSPHQPPE